MVPKEACGIGSGSRAPAGRSQVPTGALLPLLETGPLLKRLVARPQNTLPSFFTVSPACVLLGGNGGVVYLVEK